MTLDLNSLKSTLENISKTSNLEKLQEEATEAIDKFDATKKTIFSQVGEIKDGIESLTDNIDNLEDLLLPQFKINIGRITENVNVSADKLIGTVGAAASDIQSITGKAEAGVDGFLKEAITLTTPEAIEKTLIDAVGVTSNDLKNVIDKFTISTLSDKVFDTLRTNPWKDLFKSVNTYVTQLANTIGDIEDAVLSGLVEKLDKQFETTIAGILDRLPNVETINDALKLHIAGDKSKAWDLVKTFIDVPENYYDIIANIDPTEWSDEVTAAHALIDEKRDEFFNIETSFGSYVNQFSDNTSAVGFNTLPVTTAGQLPFQTSSSSTFSEPLTAKNSQGDTWSFGYISSQEELEAEFRNINRGEGREIAGATIHWSSTFLDQDIGSEWIHDVHKSMGLSGIGYHIVIRRNGSIQRGRPMSLVGEHDENNNTTFLGFCLVGGINTNSRSAVKPYWKKASSKSFTSAQWKSYDMLINTFHKVFPHAQIAGHYMTSNNGKIDPGFDVPGYSESKFNHLNLIDEDDSIWASSEPITVSDLNGNRFA